MALTEAETTTAPPLAPLERLDAELRRQLLTKRDLMADTRRVSLHVPNSEDSPSSGTRAAFEDPLMAAVDLPDGAEGLGITRHAHGQIATALGVPWKLYDRLLGTHPDLLAGLANGLLAREPARRMLRTLDGRVRAFLSDKYRPRDNYDLLDHLLPILGEYAGGHHIVRCDLTETQMYVKIALPQFERVVTPRVGDVIHGGVLVKNSEVGAGALLIAPYTTVLECLNGMVHTEFGQRRVHVGRRHSSNGEGVDAWELYSDRTLRLDDRAFFAKCGDTLRAVLNETVFDLIVAQMRDLAAMPIGADPVAAVEVLARPANVGLSEGEQGSLLRHLTIGADLTAWGYVNALTATARDLEDGDRMVELQTVAGRLTAHPADWVPALSRAVAA